MQLHSHFGARIIRYMVLVTAATVFTPAVAHARKLPHWRVPDLQFDLFHTAIGRPELRIELETESRHLGAHDLSVLGDLPLMVSPMIWAKPGSRAEDLTDELLKSLERIIGDIPSHVRDEIRRTRGYRVEDQ